MSRKIASHTQTPYFGENGFNAVTVFPSCFQGNVLLYYTQDFLQPTFHQYFRMIYGN